MEGRVDPITVSVIQHRPRRTPIARRRRRVGPVLACALLLIQLWLPDSIAQEPSPARVKVVVIEGTQLFPMHIMQTKGIAERYKLQIEQIKAAGPQGLYTIMQTGEFHVGFAGWLTIALMRAQGQKLTTVFSTYGYTNDVMVPADSPLTSFGDLRGKRIGLFGGPTAATTWLFRLQAVKFFGFDPGKEAQVHYGAPPLLMGMLEKGELDAILILDPQIVQMLETGKFRSIGNLGDIWRAKTGQDPLLVAVTVNETWAKHNPGVVKRFIAAFKEAMEHLRTHPEVWPELAKSAGIKTERGTRLLRERTARAFISRWDQKFIEEQHAYAAEVMKAFGDAGGIPRQIPDGTFDTSYVQ